MYKLLKHMPVIGLLSAACACPALAQQTVPMRERIEVHKGAGNNQEVYIGADPVDEILSFPSGEYVLDGHDLNIAAGVIKLDGDFIIRAFPAGQVKPPRDGVGPTGPAVGGTCSECRGQTGAQGGVGGPGEPGRDGGRVTIRASKITGPGHLTIIADGEGGGTGQKGGVGGTGGIGGNGYPRRCKWIGHPAESPRNGGPGGPGGLGGVGGVGGAAGNGGNFVLANRLKPYVDNQIIILSSKPGSPGAGGEQGNGGAGGQGGPRGSGASCGGGSDPGGTGVKGPDPTQAGKGKPGAEGRAGAVEYTF